MLFFNSTKLSQTLSINEGVSLLDPNLILSINEIEFSISFRQEKNKITIAVTDLFYKNGRHEVEIKKNDNTLIWKGLAVLNFDKIKTIYD